VQAEKQTVAPLALCMVAAVVVDPLAEEVAVAEEQLCQKIALILEIVAVQQMRRPAAVEAEAAVELTTLLVQGAIKSEELVETVEQDGS